MVNPNKDGRYKRNGGIVPHAAVVVNPNKDGRYKQATKETQRVVVVVNPNKDGRYKRNSMRGDAFPRCG